MRQLWLSLFNRIPSIMFTLWTFGCLYIFNLKINKYLRIKYEKIKKEKMLDVLKVNHLLSFGNIYEICDKHKAKIYNCGSLDCNYGKLGFLINLIKCSQKSLDICIFILTAREFGDAIIETFERGIKVRVITDSDKSFSSNSYINVLLQKDIPVRRKLSKYLMHHKFIIIDNEILINGSMNFTITGAYCNFENVMVTSQPQLIMRFEKCFNELWEDFSFK